MILYTGRRYQSSNGRDFSLGIPDKLELAVLIDRGHRAACQSKQIMLEKNYPTSFNEHVHVYLKGC